MSYSKSKPIYISAFIGLIGTGTYLTNGFIWHYSNDILIISNEAINKNPYKCMEENKFPCYIGNSNNIKAIIVGDSHADSLTTSLASVFDLNSEGIISLSKASCPLIEDLKYVSLKYAKTEDECLKENIKRMVFLENNYPDTPIFWVARTGAYLYGQTDPKRINSIADTKPSIYFSKNI